MTNYLSRVQSSDVYLHIACVSTGLLQADPSIIRDNKQIFRLFCHEALRVFHDRLISLDDKNSFYVILSEMANRFFGEVVI